MTLGKVAERAGVAVDTARKALRHDPSVRPYIKERVLKAAMELDYHPNLVARALRGNNLQIVPIAVLELGEFYYGELASQISRQLVQIGMEPALCFNPRHLMKMSRSFSTSGSILVFGSDYETVHELSRRQKVVTIDALLPVTPSVGNVSINFNAIYRHLAESLLRRGRRRVAIDSGHYLRCLDRGWPIQKIPAVFDVLAEAGLDTVGPNSRHVFGAAPELGAWLDAHPAQSTPSSAKTTSKPRASSASSPRAVSRRPTTCSSSAATPTANLPACGPSSSTRTRSPSGPSRSSSASSTATTSATIRNTCPNCWTSSTSPSRSPGPHRP